MDKMFLQYRGAKVWGKSADCLRFYWFGNDDDFDGNQYYQTFILRLYYEN